MSTNQIRAMEYSAKCERRRERDARRRVERFNKMVNFTIPFSAGVLTIALVVSYLI